MSKPLNRTQKLTRILRGFRKFVCSRRIIPLFKGMGSFNGNSIYSTDQPPGTLAFTLVIILTFIPQFNSLTVWPENFQNALIPTIVAATGRPIGACIQASALVLLGVAIGSINFTILASLARWTVVQAIVFAGMVYGM